MSLLQVLILLTSGVFVLLAFDLYQKKNFNLLHFLVFFGGSIAIVIFILRPNLLNDFGNIFGLARGADLIVYVAIMLLTFVYFTMVNQHTKTNHQLTRLCSSQALDTFAQSAQFTKLQQTARHDQCRIGFLIRAHNESAKIGLVIDEIVQAGYTKIVVVDDGSTDATYRILQQRQSSLPEHHIYLVRHLINRGGGAANKTLFEFVSRRDKYFGVDWWVTIDGDGQMDIADMERFVELAEQDEYDILLGSRFAEGGSTESLSPSRKFLLRIAKIITFTFSGVRVSDPFNGYRMFRSGIIDQLIISSDSLTYATELISQIKQHNWKFAEVGVDIRFSEYQIFRQQLSGLKLFRIGADFVYKHIFYR